jgi:hypothetical protein
MNKMGKIFISRSLQRLAIPILGLHITQYNFSLAYFRILIYLGGRREQDSELNDIQHFIDLTQTLKEMIQISSD